MLELSVALGFDYSSPAEPDVESHTLGWPHFVLPISFLFCPDPPHLEWKKKSWEEPAVPGGGGVMG